MYFRGEELKIGRRNGRINTYHVDLTAYCPELLLQLEEFLTVYRPRISQSQTTPFVFLTRWGAPFTAQALHTELSTLVRKHTGKRFYPHLIRTIWATEYIDRTGDYAGAAHMLGDTVEMVMKRYQEIREKDYPYNADFGHIFSQN